MRRMRTFWSGSFWLAVFLLASLGGMVQSARGQDSSWAPDEVSRLAREAPSLEQYPGMGGMVLQRKADYDLRADGALVKTERWIIQLTRDIPKAWQN
ncbi:MAG TPA: hypothetical protein PK364_07715, partial [Synergistaceae bacterium]|nr:hypothetical protein [Synergistaceae bacterium]